MVKVTLDKETFKALASDTRLDILRALDGKKMNLNDLRKATNLNKATLHEHLARLHDAGLVKRKEREGHKWVYYKLSWKGEGLLHPENTRIVVLFTTTFITLCVGILQLIWYVKGTVTGLGYKMFTYGESVVMTNEADFFRNHSLNVTVVPALETCDDVGWVTDEHLIQKLASGVTNATETNTIPADTNLTWIGTEGGFGVVDGKTQLVLDQSEGVLTAIYQDPMLLNIALACFVIFTLVLTIALWRLWENKTPKL